MFDYSFEAETFSIMNTCRFDDVMRKHEWSDSELMNINEQFL